MQRWETCSGKRHHKMWAWILGLPAVLALLTAGVTAWAANHYVVVTDSGTAILNKRYWSLRTTYVDIRAWTYADLHQHPEIRRALWMQGYRDVVTEMAMAHAQDQVTRLGERVERTWDHGMAKFDCIATSIRSRWNCMWDWLDCSPDNTCGETDDAGQNSMES
jgi:hypothetical protein